MRSDRLQAAPAVHSATSPTSGSVGRFLARTAMDQLVQRNLRGVWVRGDLPAGPAVWVSNHHSWWDFFVAVATLRSAGRTDTWVMVEPHSIGKERLFRSAGAIPTTEIRRALDVVSSGGVLVVFAEGALRAAGPVTSTEPGAWWLARRACVPVVTVAVRLVMRGQQAPEAYLDVASPRALAEDIDPAQGQLALNGLLDGLDRELADSDPEVPLPEFRQVVSGVRSWHERFGGSMVGR